MKWYVGLAEDVALQIDSGRDFDDPQLPTPELDYTALGHEHDLLLLVAGIFPLNEMCSRFGTNFFDLPSWTMVIRPDSMESSSPPPS